MRSIRKAINRKMGADIDGFQELPELRCFHTRCLNINEKCFIIHLKQIERTEVEEQARM